MSNKVEVEIQAILKNLHGEISFLQPAYEAIANSLEANATKITIIFYRDKQLSTDVGFDKISSYKVIDNGDGFTQANINSFKKLWSSHKLSFGCKGSGRFTWLKVFKKIDIESYVSETQKIVKIPFSINYDNSNIDNITAPSPIKSSVTTVAFSDITDNVLRYKTQKGGKIAIDRREVADLKVLHNNILKHLLVKLFLWKTQGHTFDICLILDNQEVHITDATIPQLNKNNFDMPADYPNHPNIPFELYYYRECDKNNSKSIYLCGNGRIAKTLRPDELGFVANIPNNDSFVMLICSNYLDISVGDDRVSFPGLEGLKQASFDKPLLMSSIIEHSKIEMNRIILEWYPNLLKQNEAIKNSASMIAPYLTPFILDNNDTLISQESLIKAATKTFAKKKIEVKDKFVQALEKRNIDAKTFQSALHDISEIALSELGEYILYRDTIIRALEGAKLDKSKYEDFVHDIFIPKKTLDNGNNTDSLTTNLWLLDDKFMTYSSAFSDLEFDKIVESIFTSDNIIDSKIGMGKKRPDVVAFYNKNVSRDALIIEFKNPNATHKEKESAIIEIKRNSFVLKEKIPEINTIWAYIITSFDHDFEISLISDNFKPRFTNAIDGKIMYSYIDTTPSHIYVIDINAITADAFARNKTFLDILRKNHSQ